jgi:hypothetical protein
MSLEKKVVSSVVDVKKSIRITCIGHERGSMLSPSENVCEKRASERESRERERHFYLS